MRLEELYVDVDLGVRNIVKLRPSGWLVLRLYVELHETLCQRPASSIFDPKARFSYSFTL